MIYIKRIMLLLFLLLLMNISSAYSIEKIWIVCKVNPDDTINETITMVVYNDDYKNLSSFSYTIPQNVENLSINASTKIKGYSALYSNGVTEIALGFEKPVPPYHYVNITFNCLVTDAVWTRDDTKQLIMNFPISAKNATIKVILPPGAVILSPQGNLLVTPSGYKITTDGKHQIIIWDLSLNKEITFTVTAKYTFISYNNQNIIEQPAISSNLKYYLIIAMVGVVAFGGLFIRERITKNKALSEVNSKLSELNDKLKEKEEEVKKLTTKIESLENELSKANKNLLNKDEIINALNEKISDYESKIQKLVEENSTYKEKAELLNKHIEKLKKENEELKDKVKNLEEIAKKYMEEKRGVLWSFLTEDEKIIIDLIKKHGHITQKEIVEITGMSKPKVSRIISELEDRKIIMKEKIGRINKLTLTEESKKLL